MRNIILYGGAFDPIHNGHLRIALEASKRFDADVYFIPGKTPPWKVANASFHHRLQMIRLAIASTGNKRLHVSLFEYHSKADVNYSVDTVGYFHSRFPKAKLYLLIGADEANVFEKWKEPERIISMAELIVAMRPGMEIDSDRVSRFHMNLLGDFVAGDVSSSAVRTLAHGDIPDVVRRYIEAHNLYYMKTIKSKLSKHRFEHVKSVARLAYEIAVANHIEDPYVAYNAGLLHDIGKHEDVNSSAEIMVDHFEGYCDMPEWTYHQFVGAYLAKTEFHIDDDRILSAIACHATGKHNMTVFEKIIYASDKIEPGRGYDSSGYIAACKQNIEEGFKIVLAANREFYHEQGYAFGNNKLSRACAAQYLGVKNE